MMKRALFALITESLGTLEMLPLTFKSAREAQDWADWQREIRGDRRAFRVMRCEQTQARAKPSAPPNRWD